MTSTRSEDVVRHQGIRRVAAGAVVAVLGAGALSAPAGAVEAGEAPGIDITPQLRDHVADLAITDGAVYVLSGYGEGMGFPSVHRMLLHETAGGTVLGNAEDVGVARTSWGAPDPTDLHAGLASTDTAVAWTTPGYEALTVLADGGTPTRGEAYAPAPVSFTGTWFTSGSELLAVDGSVRQDLTPVAAAAAPVPWTGGDRASENARATDDVVAWVTRSREAAPFEGREAVHVLAAPVDEDGVAGPAVVLHEGLVGPGFLTGGGLLDVSEDVVAWVVDEVEGSTVRWVPADDLAAAPQEIWLDGRIHELDVDGDRIAVSAFTADDGLDGFVALLSTAVPDATEIVAPALEWAGTVALHGDLLAYEAIGTDGDVEVRLVPLGERTVTALPRFTDMAADNPRVPDVDFLLLQDVATGYADGTFRPYDAVTRQAMAAFLYRTAGSPDWTAPATSPFADLAPGSPFYAEITWLADQGITEGYDGPGDAVLFRPAAPVSRQAMAAFLTRFAGEEAFEGPAASPFVDVATSHEFYDAIAWLAGTGISTGTAIGGGRFEYRPAAPVSRQAMAAFLQRLDGVLAPD